MTHHSQAEKITLMYRGIINLKRWFRETETPPTNLVPQINLQFLL